MRRVILVVLIALNAMVVAPIAQAGTYCTRVLGMSQTRNWYETGAFESKPGIDPNEWELTYVGGSFIQDWMNPAFIGYTKGPYLPSCGGAPTRAIFQDAYRSHTSYSDATIAAGFEQVIDNIFARWPSVARVDILPVVGGPNHIRCIVPGTQRYVESTTVHNRFDPIIASVVSDLDSFAGPDLLIDTCANFRDGPGHLTDVGSSYIAGVMAQAYA